MLHRHIAYLALPVLTFAVGAGASTPAAAQTAEVSLQNPPQIAPTVIVAPTLPPAAPVETVPPPPPYGSQSVLWRPGHWNWTGTAWAWTPGVYVARPQPGAVWVPGHWVAQANGEYAWVSGHWLS